MRRGPSKGVVLLMAVEKGASSLHMLPAPGAPGGLWPMRATADKGNCVCLCVRVRVHVRACVHMQKYLPATSNLSEVGITDLLETGLRWWIFFQKKMHLHMEAHSFVPCVHRVVSDPR